MGTVWPDADATPVMHANGFLLQLGVPSPRTGKPEGIVLHIGSMTVPIVLGTPEEQATLMRAVGAVPVHTLGRFSLTRERAEELRDTLNMVLTNLDRANEAVDQMLAQRAQLQPPSEPDSDGGA